MNNHLMKLLSAFPALLLGFAHVTNGQDLTLQTLPAGMVLDDNRPKETRATLQRAAAANQSDVLYLALHNGVEEYFCFEQMKTLARGKHADLLRRLLTDEQFVHPKEAPQNPGNQLDQMNRHSVVVVSACKLLGEKPPNFGRTLTRAELAALADRLKAIQ